MLTYDLNGKNKYYTLYKNIRRDILSGILRSGERLPGKRSLAAHLGVSVITVQTAYEQLLAEGYIVSEERRGYFVAEVNVAKSGAAGPYRQSVTDKKRYALDLCSGRAPDSLFPFSVWAKLMRSTLSEEGEHLLERVPADGDGALKTAISDYLYRNRGVRVNPRFVVIGAGAEYLYGVIVQLLGRERPYAIENPGYERVHTAYTLNGASCVFVPVTAKGADPSCVENSGACALHVSPSHQYPTGAVMPADVRSRILKWAQDSGAYVVEDDYDSEFRLFGKPLQPMLGLNADRVIYLNTFSKTLAPSMRMGYMVLPPALYERFERLYLSSANVVPLFEQKTLAAMLNGGYFERHVFRLKNYYRSVREKLLEKIRALPFRKQIIETGGGLHITIKFPDLTDGQIKNFAKERNINLKCVTDYLLKPCEGYGSVAVINYSSVKVEDVEGVWL